MRKKQTAQGNILRGLLFVCTNHVFLLTQKYGEFFALISAKKDTRQGVFLFWSGLTSRHSAGSAEVAKYPLSRLNDGYFAFGETAVYLCT